MPGADVLATIAEIAVAFLGFTGVVGVFSGRRHRAAVSLRLWVMVELGLVLLLLALLPLVLGALGASGPGLWAACSAATLLFVAAHALLVAPRVLAHMRSGEWAAVPAALNTAFPVAFAACGASQLANLLGLGLERSAGGFVLGLFLLLAASGLNFAALLFALQPAEPR